MRLRLCYALLFSLFLITSACQKDDDTKATPDPVTNSNPSQSAGMQAQVNGMPWEAATTSIAISGGLFNLSGFGKNKEDIVIRSFNVDKTGTYTTGAISYEIHLSGGNYKQWSASLSDSSNVFTVTKYDSVNKKISGTFSFKTTLYQGSVADSTHKTVTNGEFNDVMLP